MTDDDRKRAQAILQAIRGARADLNGPGPARQRAGRARLRFSAYTDHGPLSPHVRDVCNARGVRATKAALGTLESLAQAFAEPATEKDKEDTSSAQT